MDTMNLGRALAGEVSGDGGTVAGTDGAVPYHVAEYAERVARGAVEAMLFGHRVPVAQVVPWRLDAALRAIGRASPYAEYVAAWWHDPGVPAYRYVLRGGDTAMLARLVEPWGGFSLRDGYTAVMASPGLLHVPVGRSRR